LTGDRRVRGGKVSACLGDESLGLIEFAAVGCPNRGRRRLDRSPG
jgi:hypothetical protein